MRCTCAQLQHTHTHTYTSSSRFLSFPMWVGEGRKTRYNFGYNFTEKMPKATDFIRARLLLHFRLCVRLCVCFPYARKRVCVCVCVCVLAGVRARASGHHAVELVAVGDRLCDTWETLSCWVPLPPTQTQTLNRTRARACAHARTRTERVREIEIARESMCLQVFVASHPLHSLSPPLCHRWMLEIYAYAELACVCVFVCVFVRVSVCVCVLTVPSAVHAFTCSIT